MKDNDPAWDSAPADMQPGQLEPTDLQKRCTTHRHIVKKRCGWSFVHPTNIHTSQFMFCINFNFKWFRYYYIVAGWLTIPYQWLVFPFVPLNLCRCDIPVRQSPYSSVGPGLEDNLRYDWTDGQSHFHIISFHWFKLPKYGLLCQVEPPLTLYS